MPRTSKARRFKVQRRVDLFARDKSNKPFWLGTVWRTEAQADTAWQTDAQADHQVTAEKIMLSLMRERPQAEYRLAEEWPIGSNLRPILSARWRENLRPKVRRITIR